LGFKNASQIRDLSAFSQRQHVDFLFGIKSRRKEGKALNMVPMKVSETDEDFILLMAGGDESFAQVSDSGSGIDDGNVSRIRKRDLKTRCVPAKFLEFGITNRNRASGSVKFDFHGLILPARMKRKTRRLGLPEPPRLHISRE
jgi:hypothetical protein